MQLTATQQERIRDMVHREPLQSGEVRKIPDLGETYIALAETPADDLDELMTLTVDGVSHKIHLRFHAVN